MKAIDMHCDTIYRLYQDRHADENCQARLRSNPYQIDLEKLRRGDYLLQNIALFINKEETENPHQMVLDMAKLYYQELEQNRDIAAPAFCYEDIEKNRAAGKVSTMLTIEEGAVVRDSLEDLRKFYQLGVRMITLTWNYENGIGAPNLTRAEDGTGLWQQRNNRGLTEFGIEMVQEMERLGMIIDVSHLSDGGFRDVMKYTNKPFVASHSDAASVCNVCRNLTDDMIRELAERGGVMGLNFCSFFLTEQEKTAPSGKNLSTIADMVRHVRHIVNVGGIEVCGLGSDFDGIDDEVEFDDASGIGQLAEALLRDGFSQDEVEKIFYKNVLRVYKEVL